MHEVERRFSTGGDLLPSGIPTPWLGLGLEVHRVPTGVGSSVSYALRWHGDRPAVLWEQLGEPITLTATAVDPEWSTVEESGEALWRPPLQPRRVPVVGETASDTPSFG